MYRLLLLTGTCKFLLQEINCTAAFCSVTFFPWTINCQPNEVHYHIAQENGDSWFSNYFFQVGGVIQTLFFFIFCFKLGSLQGCLSNFIHWHQVRVIRFL